MSPGRPGLDLVLAERVRPVTLARDRHLPVHPALDRLLPEGLQHGIAVAVSAGAGGGATTLGLLLASGVSTAGGWVAVVGLPNLGLVAASELGVRFDRLVAVDCPPPKAAQAVALLLDGFAVILVGPDLLGHRDIRRIMARLREQGSVVVTIGGQQPEGISLRLNVSSVWDPRPDEVGPSGEVSLLTRRRLTVRASGRGVYSIERSDELLVEAQLFGPGGLRVESLGVGAVALRKVSGGAGR